MSIGIFIIIVISLLIIIGTYEGSLSLYRNYKRKSQFKKATIRAKELKIPLIVIGDPNNGGWSSVMGSSYGCGDLCIDIVGCKKCKNSIKGDMTEILKKLPDKSAIIYESCVLEYVDDLKKAKKEIDRVAREYYSVRIGPSLLHIYYWPHMWTNEHQMKHFIL